MRHQNTQPHSKHDTLDTQHAKSPRHDTNHRMCPLTHVQRTPQ